MHLYIYIYIYIYTYIYLRLFVFWFTQFMVPCTLAHSWSSCGILADVLSVLTIPWERCNVNDGQKKTPLSGDQPSEEGKTSCIVPWARPGFSMAANSEDLYCSITCVSLPKHTSKVHTQQWISSLLTMNLRIMSTITRFRVHTHSEVGWKKTCFLHARVQSVLPLASGGQKLID